jgi:hypothetical protein
MDKDVAQVLRGYLTLTKAQQGELVKEIENHIKKLVTGKQLDERIVKAINTGPFNMTCKCCGR